MFDLRYHVASLAAVFLMLVVGILIGVGISGRGFVDDRERDRFNDQIAGLQEEADAANATADDLERRQEAAQDFVTTAYPVLVENRLAGKNIAVAVLGSLEQDSFAFVESAIKDDADGRLARMRAVMLPLRLEAIEAELADRPEFGGYVGEEQLRNLGRDLGRELVTGGETPLWDALAPEIVEQQSGGLAEPVDGVVVIRSAEPQAGGSSRFLAGFYQGLASTGVPVVGVEPSPGRAERDPRLPGLRPLDGGRDRHRARPARDGAPARRRGSGATTASATPRGAGSCRRSSRCRPSSG